MDGKLNVMGVTHCSSVDGPGLRTVIWFQGCKNKCPGCHNPDSWDTDKEEMLLTAEQLYALAEPNKLEDGLTLSGGDPFWQKDLWTLIEFMKIYKEHNPTKTIWVYTGLTIEELTTYDSYWYKKKYMPFGMFTPYIDVLVDGRFVQDERDTAGIYRGSGNQRLIDIKAMHEKAVANPDTHWLTHLTLFDPNSIQI